LGFAGEAFLTSKVNSSVFSRSALDLGAFFLTFLTAFALGCDDSSLRLMPGLLMELCGDERDESAVSGREVFGS
jgi:hypothetical protein